jgi:hypothetical protein
MRAVDLTESENQDLCRSVLTLFSEYVQPTILENIANNKPLFDTFRSIAGIKFINAGNIPKYSAEYKIIIYVADLDVFCALSATECVAMIISFRTHNVHTYAQDVMLNGQTHTLLVIGTKLDQHTKLYVCDKIARVVPAVDIPTINAPIVNIMQPPIVKNRQTTQDWIIANPPRDKETSVEYYARYHDNVIGGLANCEFGKLLMTMGYARKKSSNNRYYVKK